MGYYGSATVLSGNFWRRGGAITSYINGPESLAANSSNSPFQHEYGHYLQSQSMGWAFLPRVGIPSLMSAGNKDIARSYHTISPDTYGSSALTMSEPWEGIFESGKIKADTLIVYVFDKFAIESHVATVRDAFIIEPARLATT